MVILFSVLVLMSVVAQTPMVRGLPPPPPPPLTYVLTLSTSYIQEASTPGVLMTLNVSNTMSGSFYGFSFNVTDPSGRLSSFVYYVGANGPVLTLTAVYPRDFTGASVKYNGTYRINVIQMYPGAVVSVATGKFYAGLTDSLSYQRTAKVSILAQGYAANETVTVRIFYSWALVPGFPISQPANGNGGVSYLWSIPVSTPLGDYNVTLSGQTTVKNPHDSQIFTVLATSVSISQLTTNSPALQGSQTLSFSFTAVYPDGSQAKTGTTTIRVVEPDGVTIHLVSMSYNTTVNSFEGTYRIASSGPLGSWVTLIDVNSFDDGYGNMGPTASVVRGFAVAPADSQNPPTSQNSQNSTTTYLLLIAVVLMAIALTVLVSWVSFFGKKKVQRSVLKVDLQSIEKEALRVQNRDFFVKVRDQLTHRQQAKPEEATKNG